MKKSLMIAVALLAIAGLMAAMAFSTASVTSYANFSVTNTDEALLALIPSEHHSAAGLFTEYPGFNKSKKLSIDWGNVQSQSVYAWKDLFAVQNNTDNEIQVMMYADPSIDSGFAPDIYVGGEGLEGEFLYDGNNDHLWSYWPWWPHYGWYKIPVASEAEVITFILAPQGEDGDSLDISTILDSEDKWITKGNYSFNLMVDAVRTDGH